MYRQLNQALADAFGDCVGNGVLQQIPIIIKRPPMPEQGDIAVPCFAYAKHVGKKPEELGADLVALLARHPCFANATFDRGFLNLTINPQMLFMGACRRDLRTAVAVPRPATIMVEYLSPNTNKPLHLGHVRNGVIGSSVANILAAVGHRVIRANLINDRGIHICKSMLAWLRFAEGATPESLGMKGDHFVGEWYVRFATEVRNNSELEREAESMLRRWEEGDPETRALWSTMNGWVLGGFADTCARYRFGFDTEYLESELYGLGKDIVAEGLSRDVFRRDEHGNVVFDLSPEEFGYNRDGTAKLATVLRNDGTSMYLTQDFGTAVRKVADFDLDRSIYVVACEQDDHFKRLFAILRALGYSWAEACHHLSYQMVELPTGRMKSREGTVVDADNLIDELTQLATRSICEKSGHNADDANVRQRAEVVGMAAIKFGLLSVDPRTKIKFDPNASVSFEGDTGPYCLYAVVRANKLLARAAEADMYPAGGALGLLGTVEERTLALDILDLERAVAQAAESYNPTPVAKGVLQIARSFSRFYTQCPIFGGETERALALERLALVDAAKSAIEYALSLLGIETVDSM